MENAVTLSFEVKPEEFNAYQKAVLARASKSRFGRLPDLAIIIAAGLFTGFSISYFNIFDAYFNVLVAGLVGAFLALVFCFVVLRRNQQSFSHSASGSLLGWPREMVIDYQGVLSQNAHMTDRVTWSAFKGTSDDSHSHYLWLSDSVALIVPKRAFPSAEAESLFRSLVSHALKTARQPVTASA